MTQETTEIKAGTLDDLMAEVADKLAPPRKLTLHEAEKLMVAWEHICEHLDDVKAVVSCGGFKNYRDFVEHTHALHEIVSRLIVSVGEKDRNEVFAFAKTRQAALEDSNE